MDKSWWVATGIAIFSLGLTAFLVKKMKPEVENYIVRVGVVLMFMGLAIFVGGIFVPQGKQEEQKSPVTIQQENFYQSPVVTGDYNQFTYSQEENSHDIARVLKGSLRFGGEEIHPLVVGEEFKVNWDIVNPGPGRAFNAWTFYKGYVEEADKGADEKVRALFENDLRQYRKNPPQGQEIGPGEDMFFTIRTPSITQQQYEGILKGTTILYFAVWVRWTDVRGVEEPPLSRCMRLHTEGLQPSDIPHKATWVFCMSAKRPPS